MQRVTSAIPAWKVFVAIFVALQAFDFVTTTVGVRLGAEEVNPLLAPIVTNWPVLLAVKVLVTIFACRVLRGRTVAAAFIACAYLLVGINNLRVIAELI